ncbi:integrase family protein [Vibrio parahaemolyticus]|nr:integrase family protein [Vibrio parahaemolyticus]
MANLTKAFITGLTRRKSKYTVSDTGTGSVSGLRVVVQPSGKKTWAVYYDTGKTLLNGRKQKASVSLGSLGSMSLEVARTKAREIVEKTAGSTAYQKRRAVAEFEAERQEKDYVKPKIEELFETYIEDRVEEGAKSVDNIRGYLIRRMPKHFLKMEARDVKMSDVENALDQGFHTDSSWNMALTFVKAAFGFVRSAAKTRDYFGLPEYNPIADIRKKRVKIKTGYIPTLQDLAQLWVECENWMTPHSANLCRAIIAGCGSRPAEIQLRKWDDLVAVNHEGKHVNLLVMPETKMEKPHSIVVNELMWECIKEADKIRKKISSHQEEWIFPSYSPYLAEYANTSGIGNSIRRARAAGAIDNPVTLKHVRHAFSTIMGDNGIKADVIARCQNHSLGSQVNERHYGRSVFIAEKLEGALAWERLLKQAIADYRARKEVIKIEENKTLKRRLAAA